MRLKIVRDDRKGPWSFRARQRVQLSQLFFLVKAKAQKACALLKVSDNDDNCNENLRLLKAFTDEAELDEFLPGIAKNYRDELIEGKYMSHLIKNPDEWQLLNVSDHAACLVPLVQSYG